MDDTLLDSDHQYTSQEILHILERRLSNEELDRAMFGQTQKFSHIKTLVTFLIDDAIDDALRGKKWK